MRRNDERWFGYVLAFVAGMMLGIAMLGGYS